MANWCNARLIVFGARNDVLEFGKLVRTNPERFFSPDMIEGEGRDLLAERMVRIKDLGGDYAQKEYLFQIRNDDGEQHFTQLSKIFTRMLFVLIYGNYDAGSYLIESGKAKKYEIPQELLESTMEKHKIDENGDTIGEDEFELVGYWEAQWELMDLAGKHWDEKIREKLGAEK